MPMMSARQVKSWLVPHCSSSPNGGLNAVAIGWCFLLRTLELLSRSGTGLATSRKRRGLPRSFDGTQF
jgi:hypothetical protein